MLGTTEHVPPVYSSGPSHPVPSPISTSYASPIKPKFASEITSIRSDVGLSSNAFDTVQGTPSTINLGFVYSNGFRYRYLRLRSTGLIPGSESCSFVTPDSVVRRIVNTNTGPVLEDVKVGGTVLTGAYIGNAVVPPLASPNTITCGRASLKVEPIPTNINC